MYLSIMIKMVRQWKCANARVSNLANEDRCTITFRHKEKQKVVQVFGAHSELCLAGKISKQGIRPEAKNFIKQYEKEASKYGAAQTATNHLNNLIDTFNPVSKSDTYKESAWTKQIPRIQQIKQLQNYERRKAKESVEAKTVQDLIDFAEELNKSNAENCANRGFSHKHAPVIKLVVPPTWDASNHRADFTYNITTEYLLEFGTTDQIRTVATDGTYGIAQNDENIHQSGWVDTRRKYHEAILSVSTRDTGEVYKKLVILFYNIKRCFKNYLIKSFVFCKVIWNMERASKVNRFTTEARAMRRRQCWSNNQCIHS